MNKYFIGKIMFMIILIAVFLNIIPSVFSQGCTNECVPGDYTCFDENGNKGGLNPKYYVPCSNKPDSLGCYHWCQQSGIGCDIKLCDECRDDGLGNAVCVEEDVQCGECIPNTFKCDGETLVPCLKSSSGCYKWDYSPSERTQCIYGCQPKSGSASCNPPPEQPPSCISECLNLPDYTESKCDYSTRWPEQIIVSCGQGDTDICWEWDYSTAQTCVFGCTQKIGYATCNDRPACKTQCTLGEKRCFGNAFSTCIRDPNDASCNTWDNEFQYCPYGCEQNGINAHCIGKYELIDIPDSEFESDIYTVGLWHFNETNNRFNDKYCLIDSGPNNFTPTKIPIYDNTYDSSSPLFSNYLQINTINSTMRNQFAGLIYKDCNATYGAIGQPQNVIYNPPKSASFEGFIRTKDSANEKLWLFHHAFLDYYGDKHYWWVYLEKGFIHSDIQFKDKNGINGFNLTSKTNITDNNWHYILANYGSKGMQLYIDGIMEDFNNYTGSYNLYYSAFKLMNLTWHDLSIFSPDTFLESGSNLYENLSVYADEFRLSNTQRFLEQGKFCSSTCNPGPSPISNPDSRCGGPELRANNITYPGIYTQIQYCTDQNADSCYSYEESTNLNKNCPYGCEEDFWVKPYCLDYYPSFPCQSINICNPGQRKCLNGLSYECITIETTDINGTDIQCNIWDEQNPIRCPSGKCAGNECFVQSDVCILGQTMCYDMEDQGKEAVISCFYDKNLNSTRWCNSLEKDCIKQLCDLGCTEKFNSATNNTYAVCIDVEGWAYNMSNNLIELKSWAGILFYNPLLKAIFIFALMVIIGGLVTYLSQWQTGIFVGAIFFWIGIFIGWLPPVLAIIGIIGTSFYAVKLIFGGQ